MTNALDGGPEGTDEGAVSKTSRAKKQRNGRVRSTASGARLPGPALGSLTHWLGSSAHAAHGDLGSKLCERGLISVLISLGRCRN